MILLRYIKPFDQSFKYFWREQNMLPCKLFALPHKRNYSMHNKYYIISVLKIDFIRTQFYIVVCNMYSLNFKYNNCIWNNAGRSWSILNNVIITTHESSPIFSVVCIKIAFILVWLKKPWVSSFLMEVPQCCHGSQRLAVQMLEGGQRLELFA